MVIINFGFTDANTEQHYASLVKLNLHGPSLEYNTVIPISVTRTAIPTSDVYEKMFSSASLSIKRM